MMWREFLCAVIAGMALLTWRFNEMDKQVTARMKIMNQQEAAAAVRELSGSLDRTANLLELTR